MARKPLSALLGGVTRFGKLTVLHEAESSNGDRKALCRCDCGTIKSVYVSHLRRGNSRSCGCEVVRGKPKHGQFYHPLYGRWNAMVQRCTNPKHKDYPSYGGRGVEVCARWLEDPRNFFEDMGPCPQGMSIEREDVNGNYEPSNCSWQDARTQAQNKRAVKLFLFRGEELCLAEICRRAGISGRYDAMYKRMRRGLSLTDALAVEGVAE